LPGLKAFKLELGGEEPREEMEGKVDDTDACQSRHERCGGRESTGSRTKSGIYQNVEKVENTSVSG
jgi:hypothetical protein